MLQRTREPVRCADQHTERAEHTGYLLQPIRHAMLVGDWPLQLFLGGIKRLRGSSPRTLGQGQLSQRGAQSGEIAQRTGMQRCVLAPDGLVTSHVVDRDGLLTVDVEDTATAHRRASLARRRISSPVTMQTTPPKIIAASVIKNGKAELIRRWKTSPACSGETTPGEDSRLIHS